MQMLLLPSTGGLPQDVKKSYNIQKPATGDVLKNFKSITAKIPCWSMFLIKLLA